MYPFNTTPLMIIYGVNTAHQLSMVPYAAIAPTVLDIRPVAERIIDRQSGLVQTIRSPRDKIYVDTIALNLQPPYDPVPGVPNPTEPRYWGEIGKKDRKALLSLKDVGRTDQPRLLYLPRHYGVKDAAPLYDLCDVPIFSLYDQIDCLPDQDNQWAFRRLLEISSSLDTFGVAIDIRTGVTHGRILRNTALACGFGASVITYFNYSRSDADSVMFNTLRSASSTIDNPVWKDLERNPKIENASAYSFEGSGFRGLINQNGAITIMNNYQRRIIG